MAKDKCYLFEQYKMVNSGCEKYFDFLYRKISVSIVFFTTTVLYALNEDTTYIAKELLFLYIIPIFGYLFGLLYCYDISAIAKLGLHTVCIENELKSKNKKFISYISENKKYKKGYILSYGTSLIFYMVMPLITIILGIGQITEVGNKELFFHQYILIKIFLLYVAPWMFYVIYVVFCVIIFMEIHTLMKKTREKL